MHDAKDMEAIIAQRKKDLLKGGKADKVPPEAFPKSKVEEGAKVEREHTTSKRVAKEIARDHLTEDMDYYRKLKKMEKQAQVDGFLDEIHKIATGLAPPGAPAVNGRGGGLTPSPAKMPKANGSAMQSPTAGPGAIPRGGF